MQGGKKNLCVWHIKSKCDPAPTLGLLFCAIKTANKHPPPNITEFIQKEMSSAVPYREDLQD